LEIKKVYVGENKKTKIFINGEDQRVWVHWDLNFWTINWFTLIILEWRKRYSSSECQLLKWKMKRNQRKWNLVIIQHIWIVSLLHYIYS